MKYDGSIVIGVDADVSKANKSLAKLKGKIKDLETSISDKQSRRNPLAEQAEQYRVELEKARKSFDLLKADQAAAAAAMRPGASPEDFIRAQADKPRIDAAVAAQEKNVEALQKKWEAATQKVAQYDRELAEANVKLDEMKTDAGALQQEIERANSATGRMGRAMKDAGEKMDKSMGRFSSRLREVLRSALVFTVISQGMAALRGWLGQVIMANDEARASIAQLKGALLTLAQPILEVVIPAFIALIDIITSVITVVAQFVAMLFGKTIDQSKKAAAGLNKEAAAFGGVGGAAEEAEGSLASFDEINTITTENAGGGGGGGGGGVSGIAPDFGFDTLGDSKLKALMEDLLELATGIGSALLTWKLASTFFPQLNKAKKLLGSLLIGAGITLAVDNISAILSGEYKNASWQSIVKNLLSGIALGGGVAAIAGTPVGWSIVIATILTFGVTSIITNWPKIKSMWGNIVDMFESYFTYDLMGALDNFGDALFDWMSMDDPLMSVYEWITDAIFGDGHWDKAMDFLAPGGLQVDIFDGLAEETTAKLQPFLDSMRDFDNSLKELEITRAIIDDSVVEDTRIKLQQIVTAITTELDSDKNEALANLNPLKEFMEEDQYAAILAQTDKYYTEMNKKVTDGQDAITAILEKASSENRAVTDEEWQEIYRIQSEMQDAGVLHLTESEEEYNTVMQRLKSNSISISLEQASEIIKNAKKTREETILEAEKQYDGIIAEAETLREAGIINDDEYQAMIDAAESAKTNTINAANEQYQTIYDTATKKLGATSVFIDKETGDIKSKWDVFCENVSRKWKDKWEEIKSNLVEKIGNIKQAIDDFKQYWSEKWDAIKQKVSDVVGSIGEFISGIGQKLSGLISNLGSAQSKAQSAARGAANRTTAQATQTTTLSVGRAVPALATGTVVPPNREFMAILGDNKTETEIVSPLSTMKQAFLEALQESGGMGGGEIRVVLNIDGEKLAANQVRHINNMTRSAGKPVLLF